jgi:hypothetical protein
MSPKVLNCLLGRVPNMISPAFLPKRYSRHPVIEEMFPAVINDNDPSHSESLSWALASRADIQN